MHGRKRSSAAPDDVALKAAASKLEAYQSLSEIAFRYRASRDTSPLALSLCGKLLTANPDVATLWNYVREALLLRFEGAGRCDEAAFRAGIADQLALSASAIMRNPKSYPAWHHRQWLVERYSLGRRGDEDESGLSPAPAPAVISLADELALCSKMLSADERNFHCWKYRRWVANLAHARATNEAAAAAVLAAELAFTSEAISRNFSNYSAWHARTHLLPRAAEGPHGVALDAAALQKELCVVQRAVFTEPDDQSPWFFRRWVVSRLSALIEGSLADDVSEAAAAEGAAAAAVLLEDLRELKKLEAADPECKWPLEAQAHTVALLARSSAFAAMCAAGRVEAAETPTAEAAAQMYERLAILDARHAQYFSYARGKCLST